MKERCGAYHGRVGVQHADHLDVDALFVHILQQAHHLGHAHPFALCVAHGNNVVSLFEPIFLRTPEEETGVREEELGQSGGSTRVKPTSGPSIHPQTA